MLIECVHKMKGTTTENHNYLNNFFVILEFKLEFINSCNYMRDVLKYQLSIFITKTFF